MLVGLEIWRERGVECGDRREGGKEGKRDGDRVERVERVVGRSVRTMWVIDRMVTGVEGVMGKWRGENGAGIDVRG